MSFWASPNLVDFMIIGTVAYIAYYLNKLVNEVISQMNKEVKVK